MLVDAVATSVCQDSSTSLNVVHAPVTNAVSEATSVMRALENASARYVCFELVHVTNAMSEATFAMRALENASAK